MRVAVVLIALALAWPSYGVSLLLIPLYFIGRGYLRGRAAKARNAYLGAEQQATDAIQQDHRLTPSWVGKPQIRKTLDSEVLKAVIEAGMTAPQGNEWLAREDVTAAMLTTAACFEKADFSKSEQIVGTCDFLKRLAGAQLAQDQARVQPQVVAPVARQAEAHPLFEHDAASALECSTQEAIDLYTRSIATSSSPTLYLNRARLLSKRLRHFEALQDLQQADQLDRAQGQELSAEIARELASAQNLTAFYHNGVRETLPTPSDGANPREIAEAILQDAFDIAPAAWDNNLFDDRLLTYHFFYDLASVVRFEDLEAYPEVVEWARTYPPELIVEKLANCPDTTAYHIAERKLQTYLCCYSEADMCLLRRMMLYSLFTRLHASLKPRL